LVFSSNRDSRFGSDTRLSDEMLCPVYPSLESDFLVVVLVFSDLTVPSPFCYPPDFWIPRLSPREHMSFISLRVLVWSCVSPPPNCFSARVFPPICPLSLFASMGPQKFFLPGLFIVHEFHPSPGRLLTAISLWLKLFQPVLDLFLRILKLPPRYFPLYSAILTGRLWGFPQCSKITPALFPSHQVSSILALFVFFTS